MQNKQIRQTLSEATKHLAISGESKTTLLSPQTLETIWDLPFEYQAISFLYRTGLFAIVSSSTPAIASIYDYKYKRHVKDIDFVSPIVTLHYSRNVLFVVSENKVQGYDLSTDQSILYLKIKNGQKLFHSYFHETLHIGYVQNESGNFVSHSIWDGHKFQLQEMEYSEGRYTERGEYFILRIGNNINVYTNNSLINIIHLPSPSSKYLLAPVQQITPSPSVPILIILQQNQQLAIKVQSLFRLQKSSSVFELQSTKQLKTGVEFQGVINGKLVVLAKSQMRIYAMKDD